MNRFIKLYIFLLLFLIAAGRISAQGALDFDGTDDYVLVPHSNSLNISNNITIEAWIYWTGSNTTSNAANIIADKRADNSLANYDLYVHENNSKIGFYANASIVFSTATVPTNTWVHVAYTNDNGAYTFYLNGVAGGSGSQNLGPTNTNPLRIGSNSGVNAVFSGKIDELRIWNVTRSPSEIAASYNKTFTGTFDPLGCLVAYYKMENGSGTTLSDITGKNDGTLTNMDPATDWVASGASIANTSAPSCTIEEKNALAFNGTNNKITSIANVGISGNASRTVETWIKTSKASGGSTFFNWGVGSGGTGKLFTFHTSNGKLRIGIQGGFVEGGFIADGNWHHVAVTYDVGRANAYELYIDGALSVAGNIATALNTTNTPITLGARDVNVSYFLGSLDEVRVWNTARTGAQIKDNKDCELVGNESGLVTYYTFNQGIASGSNAGETTLKDLASPGNNATLTNFTLTGSTSNWVANTLTTPVVAVSIASDDADNTIASGTSVTFTATPTYEGGTPTYQWKKNGANVGTNSATYTDAGLVHGDAIKVEMTSSVTCASPTMVTSNEITTTVTSTNDFTLNSLGVTTSLIEVGNSTVVSVNQAYTGSSSAAINSTIGYYLSSDNIHDGTDVLLGTNTSALSTSNLSATENATLTIPVSTTPAIYYLIAKADHLNDIGEADETNNTATITLRIRPSLSTPPPANSVSPNTTQNEKPGDPVDVASGAFSWIQADLSLSDMDTDYGLARFYTSTTTYDGALGHNWSHSFDIHLEISGNDLTVHHGEGHFSYFLLYGDGGTVGKYVGMTDMMYQDGANYILEQKDGIKYTFNSSGVLQTIIDRNSNTTTFTYTSGDLTKVTFAGGRYFEFTYSSNRIATAADNSGRTVSYEYDGNGDLTKVTDAAGGIFEYTYDGSHQITSVKDPRNITVIQNVYTSNKVTSQTDAIGGIFTFQYDTPIANASTVTDALNNTAVYYHDEAFRLIRKTDESGNDTYYEYDIYNNFTKVTDEKGNITNINYDIFGNTLEVEEPLSKIISSVYNDLHLPTAITNPANKSIAFTYDANGNTTNIAFPNGSNVVSTYSLKGQLLTETDANGNVQTRQYDNTTGDVIGIVSTTGTATLAYDNLGRVTSTTDRNGKTTTFVYDNLSNITKMTDPMGFFIEMTYDANGNVTSEKGRDGTTTTYTYDNKDRLTKVTDALGRETTYAYDLMDRLTTTTDARSNATTYIYDATGLMTSYTTPLGTTTFTYDAGGNVVSTKDALNNTTTFAYNALNQLISITNALNETETLTYNAIGELATSTDAAGNTTTYTYDDMGKVIQVQDPINGTNTFTYDAHGNMLTYVDAESQTTTMTYNGEHSLLTKTDGAGHTTTYTYDNEGNMQTIVDPNGETTTITLNDNYDETQIAYSGGGTSQYTYNNSGDVLTSTNASGTTTYVRNALGEVTQVTDPFGNATAYTYDAVGNVTEITYANSKKVTITYNAADLPTNVTDWVGNSTTRTYNANGDLIQAINSNGTKAVITRDALNRTKTFNNYQPGNVIISSDVLSYNNIGNIVNRLQTAPIYPTIPSAALTYQYGNDNRLTTASTGTYTTNNNGARTASSISGKAAAYTWGESGLLKTYTLNSILTQNTHDGERNLIKDIKGGTEVRYQLDLTSELPQVLRELDNANAVIASYIYVPGDGLAWRLDDQEEVHFYAFDYIGHTLALTDDNGNITDTYASDVFGDYVNHVGTTTQPFQFLGKYGVQYKGEGHYHIRARDYDATTGTFLSKDEFPIDFSSTQLTNQYAYVANDPFSSVDIDGFKSTSVVLNARNFSPKRRAFITFKKKLSRLSPRQRKRVIGQMRKLKAEKSRSIARRKAFAKIKALASRGPYYSMVAERELRVLKKRIATENKKIAAGKRATAKKKARARRRYLSKLNPQARRRAIKRLRHQARQRKSRSNAWSKFTNRRR